MNCLKAMEMCLMMQESNSKETEKNKHTGSCQSDFTSKTRPFVGIVQEQSRRSTEIDASFIHVE